MKILITGANGFLGREVVTACLAAGHQVRALVRPATPVQALGWGDRVELFRADLRGGVDLDPAFEGVDIVCHLATQMSGDDSSILGGSIVGTERLLAAMRGSAVQHLVLVSSFSVYDWRRSGRRHDEATPLLEAPHQGGAYATAKLWQERLALREAENAAWSLVVLRPGFLWGRGNDDLACVGQRIGRRIFVFGPSRSMPLAHVTNCADAVCRAAESESEGSATFDVHDGFGTSAIQYARLWAQRSKQGSGPGLRVIPVPHILVKLLISTVNIVSRILFGSTGKLPSFFTPVRFDLRYKPVEHSNAALTRGLNWAPPNDLEACAEATWGPRPTASSLKEAA